MMTSENIKLNRPYCRPRFGVCMAITRETEHFLLISNWIEDFVIILSIWIAMRIKKLPLPTSAEDICWQNRTI